MAQAGGACHFNYVAQVGLGLGNPLDQMVVIVEAPDAAGGEVLGPESQCLL